MKHEELLADHEGNCKQVYFLEELFEPGELICSAANHFGVAVHDWWDVSPFDLFVSINPMHTKRADANVTSFRNILVEFDKGSIEEQRKIINDSGLPYTALTFSGNKSLHAVIRLAEPMPNEQSYRNLVAQIYAKMGGKEVVDMSAGNPSRFTRIPGGYRDGVLQKLLDLNGKIDNNELRAWLGPQHHPGWIPNQHHTAIRFRGDINSNTMDFLINGAPEGEWNSTLFKAACDLTRAKFELHEIENRCAGVTGHLDKDDRETIKSAYKRARIGND